MKSERRLIDANALLEKAIWGKIRQGTDYETDAKVVTTGTIGIAPTVEAVPVVHGRWKNEQTNSIFTWHLECSVCGADYHVTVGYNYCPNCGAKMDGDVDG